MDMLPTLCAAMARAGGHCLVLKTGQPPHVLTADGPHDLARAILSPQALETLISQIFSEAGRWSLDEAGVVEEQITVSGSGTTLVARAHRHDDSVSIELHDANPLPGADRADADGALDERAFDAMPEMVTIPTDDLDEPVHDIGAADLDGALAGPSGRYEALFAEADADADADAPSTLEFVDPAAERFRAMPSAAPVRGVLVDLATLAMRRGATALYARTETPVLARIDDRLEPVSGAVVDAWQFEALLEDVNALRAGATAAEPGYDWTRQLPGVGAISGRLFDDDRGSVILLRLRPDAASRPLLKFIPAKVRAACDGDGLVVVAAGTAADVVAMAAAVGDVAGRQRGGYVIALRPAGTAQHEIAGAFVSHRELHGSDAEVAAAIHAAASETPDVLVIAPPSGDAAFREAVHAADGGRLVVLAVPAPTSLQALRAVAGRSGSGDAQTRLALATSFRAAFTYRLIRRLGGGRALVRDVLVGTSEISALLASGDFQGVGRVQREGAMGMSTVDDSLARAVRRGHVSLRQAAANAIDRRHLVSLVRTWRRRDARNQARTAQDGLEAAGLSRRAGDGERWSGLD